MNHITSCTLGDRRSVHHVQVTSSFYSGVMRDCGSRSYSEWKCISSPKQHRFNSCIFPSILTPLRSPPSFLQLNLDKLIPVSFSPSLFPWWIRSLFGLHLSFNIINLGFIVTPVASVSLLAHNTPEIHLVHVSQPVLPATSTLECRNTRILCLCLLSGLCTVLRRKTMQCPLRCRVW